MIYLDNIGADSFLYYRSAQDKGYGVPIRGPDELVVTQNREILSQYFGSMLFSEYLGLHENLGLYELFSFFFEGRVQSDFDMLDALFSGFVEDSDWCFCLKVGVTFCWFTVSKTELVKLGSMQFSESMSKYTVGRFIKRLRYGIVKTGVNLSRVKYLVWDKEDLGYEFSNYILKYDCLSSFFSNVDGLRGLDIESVMHFLSKKLQVRYQVTADNFVDCLNESFFALRLEQFNGVLYSRNAYYKDYSICISQVVDSSKCSYGMMLDTEGVQGADGAVTNGCREIGGLIYSQYNGVVTCIDMFSCDSNLLEETLTQAIKNYREFSGSVLGKIDVICYGGTDEKLLTASVKSLCSRKFIKTFSNTFSFVDCRDFVLENMGVDVSGRESLANIARSLCVMPLFPKHKPLNDVRTLFNILCKILIVSGKFPI